MSAEALIWAAAQKLPIMPKGVLFALADCHNGRSGRCFPSIPTIAEKAGTSVTTVHRCLKQLVGLGYVTKVERKRPDGTHASNDYIINFDAGGYVRIGGGKHEIADATPRYHSDTTPFAGGAREEPSPYQSDRGDGAGATPHEPGRYNQEGEQPPLSPTSSDSPPGGVFTLRGDDEPAETPYEVMARVWRDVLPELPRPSVPTPKRQSACKARWAQMPAAKMSREEFWRRLCVRIGNSPFLMGETTDWKATFDWAIRPDNFMKLWEGHYQSQPRRPQRVDVTDPARFGF